MDIRKRRSFFTKLPKDAPICFNCKHFVRHYYMDKAYYFQPLNVGHCTFFARSRKKRTFDKCHNFSSKCEKA